MIALYTAPTPNGWKVSIALEELGLDYEPRVLDLREREQKQDWFLAISPNGRIPAIVDQEAEDFAVFESGAILLYLAEKTGALLPSGTRDRSLAIQWLMFQMGHLGPMQGQAHVFRNYAPERVPYAIARYERETARLYGVLDRRLSEAEYLADEYSVADIAAWPWIKSHRSAGIELPDYPALERWFKRVGEREAVRRGSRVPEPVRTDDESFREGIRAILD